MCNIEGVFESNLESRFDFELPNKSTDHNKQIGREYFVIWYMKNEVWWKQVKQVKKTNQACSLINRSSIFVCSASNTRTPTFINFLIFFQGLWPYSRLHRAYFSSISIRYKWGYAYSFCQTFQRLRLFKGLRLFQTLE